MSHAKMIALPISLSELLPFDEVFTDLVGTINRCVRLETRRSQVQPLLRSATFFRGD